VASSPRKIWLSARGHGELELLAVGVAAIGEVGVDGVVGTDDMVAVACGTGVLGVLVGGED